MPSQTIGHPVRAAVAGIDAGALTSRIAALASPDDRESIAQRLRFNLPLLADRLEKLYGRRPDFADWLESLLAALAGIHAARSPELRALDKERLAEPGWFLGQEMLAYSAYVDRFAGTLAGVAARVPHLKRLGVTYLHLLPFLRAREGLSDGGFAVASYEEVEPALGTMADLETLTAALRCDGISLCSDFVLNHVADTHAWALAAKAGSARHRAYFHCLAASEAEAYEATLGQIFPETAPGNFTHVPEIGAEVWTTFYPYQWDLNYANPEVFAEMAGALLRLANRGIEVFRLDSAAFLWKRKGTNSMNQPEAHWILQAFRGLVDIFAPGVLLKAEAIVPTSELSPYLGLGEAHGRECHLAYQSSLMAAAWLALATEDTRIARQIIRDTPLLPPRTSWLTYVRCHDDIGWNVLKPEFADGDIAPLRAAAGFFAGQGESYAAGALFQAVDPQAVHGTNGMAAALTGFARAGDEGEVRRARQRLALLYALALSVGGMPMIYMGDEHAQGNDPTPAGDYSAGVDGRQLHRPLFDESRSQDPAAQAVFAELRHLVATRRTCPALAAAVPTQLVAAAAPGLLAFWRGSGLCCLYNFTAHDQHLDLAALEVEGGGSLAGGIDLVTGQPVGREPVLAPWHFVWLQAAPVKA